MEHLSASAMRSAEHLSELKQRLQEINDLLPLLPAPDSTSEDGAAPTPEPSDLAALHRLHMSAMIEEFRKDVNLYLTLSELTPSRTRNDNTKTIFEY